MPVEMNDQSADPSLLRGRKGFDSWTPWSKKATTQRRRRREARYEFIRKNPPCR